MFITGLQPIWKISSIVILLYRSPIFIKPGKKQQSFRFKFAEVKSHLRLRKRKKLPKRTANLRICDCGPPNAILRNLGLRNSLNLRSPALLKSLSTAALEGKEVLYWTNSFFSAASAKKLSSIFFAGTADRNPFIRFAAASFFGSDWLNKQPKNLSLLTDSTSLSLSPLSLLAPLVHNKARVSTSHNSSC